MWRDIGMKAALRWVWHALDHPGSLVVAYLFGRRKDAVFLQRQALLHRWMGDLRAAYGPCAACRRYTAPADDRKHASTLRTRIQRVVRRTMGLSTTTTRHDLVIRRFSNRYTCDLLI
jgi:insertion element IS1 protein InsB